MINKTLGKKFKRVRNASNLAQVKRFIEELGFKDNDTFSEERLLKWFLSSKNGVNRHA
jgi:predicted lactoylglutathione lyase